jgi:hypothetical protein
MGQAVLDTHADVTAIRLIMPNKHHLPVDLSRFGLENRNEIFVATEEPYGLIEATLVRETSDRRPLTSARHQATAGGARLSRPAARRV